MDFYYCGCKKGCLQRVEHARVILITFMPLLTQRTVPLLRSFGPQVRDDKEKWSMSAWSI
jgi:hypothetical protein